MTDLKEKKILVFSPYGATKHYGEAIKKELIRRGAEVYGYDERPSQRMVSKIMVRLFKNSIPQLFDNYIKKVLNELSGQSIDYILICRGEAFTPLSIKHLRESFPNAKVILFLWDILAYCNKRNIIQFCDKVFSFDPEDVKNNDGLLFRPTFYIDKYTKVENKENKYDMAFIGTVYPPRQKTIKFLTKSFHNQGLRFYRYMFVPSIIIYFRNLFKGFPFFHIWQIHLKPLTIEGITEVLSVCRSIIDINPPIQKSLSTRPYEAMAAHKKYITTNREIENYDFYNPNNIYVIDIANPIIPKSFLESPFEEIPQEILYKYSVKGLIDDLFRDNN